MKVRIGTKNAIVASQSLLPTFLYRLYGHHVSKPWLTQHRQEQTGHETAARETGSICFNDEALGITATIECRSFFQRRNAAAWNVTLIHLFISPE